MKTAALYLRVSTLDQHPETQMYDLRGLAAQRGFEIVHEYTDRISGAKAKRPGLDQLLADARRGKFEIVLVWAFDRIARSTRHFLEVLDELNHINVEFVSFRENVDTSGPLGRAMVVIIGAIAELERNLIIERVRAGMRRAKLEGRQIGRTPMQVDRVALLQDRENGKSLADLVIAYRISKASVCRVLKDARRAVSTQSDSQQTRGEMVLVTAPKGVVAWIEQRPSFPFSWPVYAAMFRRRTEFGRPFPACS